MSKKFQCQRAFLKSEADAMTASVWEVMGLHEDTARNAIREALRMDGFRIPEDIYFDWTRQKDPETFVLRAWCLAKRTD